LCYIVPAMEKKTNSFLRECDLYAPVKAYLQALGWEVKAEVTGCDAAAMKDGKLLAAELKLTLNLDVVLQAVGRQRIADIVYIAVPKKPKSMRSQRWRDTLELLKRLNIGLLIVSNPGGRPDVEEWIEPVQPEEAKPPRGRASRRRLRAMNEFSRRTGDRNTGGVRGRKIITAYREAALRLAARLNESGPASAKEMKPEGENSKKTYALLKNNHYGWFKPLGGGLFDVTEQGRAALDIYHGILEDDTPPDDAEFSGTIAE
jgi:hypothetical protein